VLAAKENILNSSRSTEFITPKSKASRVFRDAVLKLAKRHEFARRLVNSGRLSVPSTLLNSSLNTPDSDQFAGAMVPGAVAADAPIRFEGRDGWFLDHVRGEFTGLLFVEDPASVKRETMPVRTVICALHGTEPGVVQDVAGLLAKRYDARPGTCYLLRPDQHVCGRWRKFDPDLVRAALRRATCNT
jgi:3-(3-hydroxy-phenyl)propionate hydroxylase